MVAVSVMKLPGVPPVVTAVSAAELCTAFTVRSAVVSRRIVAPTGKSTDDAPVP